MIEKRLDYRVGHVAHHEDLEDRANKVSETGHDLDRRVTELERLVKGLTEQSAVPKPRKRVSKHV